MKKEYVPKPLKNQKLDGYQYRITAYSGTGFMVWQVMGLGGDQQEWVYINMIGKKGDWLIPFQNQPINKTSNLVRDSVVYRHRDLLAAIFIWDAMT
jgi:hypothetical protein